MSVVVITGAGQGQGAAEARLLAARGVTVIAADLGATPAEDLATAEYRQLDVTDEAGWAALAKDLAGLTGSLTYTRIAHTASKGGVVAMTRQLAAEGAGHGIRANSISPGLHHRRQPRHRRRLVRRPPGR